MPHKRYGERNVFVERKGIPVTGIARFVGIESDVRAVANDAGKRTGFTLIHTQTRFAPPQRGHIEKPSRTSFQICT